MNNFLGIPNFLIKIGVNNLQNKMNIKKNKKKKLQRSVLSLN